MANRSCHCKSSSSQVATIVASIRPKHKKRIQLLKSYRWWKVSTLMWKGSR